MSSGKANEIVGDWNINGTLITASPATLNNTSGTNTGDQTISLTGDVTGSGVGSFAATIANNAVTYAKMQQESKVTLLGNPTGSTANVQEIVLGTNLSFSGSTLNASGGTSPLTTKGDTYTYGSADARLPIGPNGQIRVADSTQTTGSAWDYPDFPLTKSVPIIWEASGGNATTADNVPSSQVSGTGAQILLSTATTNGTVFGVAVPETGSTTTGRAYWSSSGTSLFVAGGQLIFEASVKVPTLSNGTDRFAVSIGLTSTFGSGKFADGGYFYYRDDVNSGNWQCETALFGSSGTPHITTTNTAVNTSQNRFKIIFDATCANVYFYINDVLVATDSTATNMPLATPLRTGVGLLKSLGTNSLTVQIDYKKIRKDFTTAR